jgi:hypothetical protein
MHQRSSLITVNTTVSSARSAMAAPDWLERQRSGQSRRLGVHPTHTTFSSAPPNLGIAQTTRQAPQTGGLCHAQSEFQSL